MISIDGYKIRKVVGSKLDVIMILYERMFLMIKET